MKNNDKLLIKTIENDEWISVKKNMLKKLKDTARNTILKDQRMNVRISKRDLVHLKAKALEEGIPYQTLVTSIIHKYINGNFREIVKK
jgi:predicted DNA binding CopG/RHH family protein